MWICYTVIVIAHLWLAVRVMLPLITWPELTSTGRGKRQRIWYQCVRGCVGPVDSHTVSLCVRVCEGVWSVCGVCEGVCVGVCVGPVDSHTVSLCVRCEREGVGVWGVCVWGGHMKLYARCCLNKIGVFYSTLRGCGLVRDKWLTEIHRTPHQTRMLARALCQWTRG